MGVLGEASSLYDNRQALIMQLQTHDTETLKIDSWGNGYARLRSRSRLMDSKLNVQLKVGLLERVVMHWKLPDNNSCMKSFPLETGVEV